MAEPTKVETLGAALVLLLDAAKPTPEELAKAVVAALPVTERYQFASKVDMAVGFVTLSGIDTITLKEDIEARQMTCTATDKQLWTALHEATSAYEGDDLSLYYEEALDLLEKQGLLTPKPQPDVPEAQGVQQ